MLTAIRLLSMLLLFAGCLWCAPAYAAESYDNCTGFIDTVPTTITTQGTWCLRQDISTPLTQSDAITINANNVTIDCNDFKIGGLSAGIGTESRAFFAWNRLNITVRHCNIRGFRHGVYFGGSDGGGHLVEDNRLDGNTYFGLLVNGDGSVVRRNVVRDTGGTTVTPGIAIGIGTAFSVDLQDNTVSGILPGPDAGGRGDSYGISTNYNSGGMVSGNKVRGLVSLGAGVARGITNTNSSRLSLLANQVIGSAAANSIGIYCTDADSHATDNVVNGFATAIQICSSGSNAISP